MSMYGTTSGLPLTCLEEHDGLEARVLGGVNTHRLEFGEDVLEELDVLQNREEALRGLPAEAGGSQQGAGLDGQEKLSGR